MFTTMEFNIPLIVIVIVVVLFLIYCLKNKKCFASKDDDDETPLGVDSRRNRYRRRRRRSRSTTPRNQDELASPVSPVYIVNENTISGIHSGHGRNETELSVPTGIVKVNVIEVPDGDGAKVLDVDAEEILDIRLIGIDAPEMKGRQPFAVKSKTHLEGLVLHETAILTKYGLDQYHRVLGNLKVPGKVENVSLEMLKAGLAHIYEGKGAEYGGMRTEFIVTEYLAKMQRKGLWAQDKVVLPRDFKRMQRELNPH